MQMQIIPLHFSRKISMLSIALALWVALQPEAQASKLDFERVSLVSILANPEKCGGKRVMLVGYVRWEPRHEHQALYLTRDDAQLNNTMNSVWLDSIAATNFVGKNPPSRRGFVRVVGTLRVSNAGSGHFGLWPAALEDITVLVRVKKK